jgi:hypothetical protein
MDETEQPRREMVQAINGAVESESPLTERQRLEGIYGKVWDTDEVRNEFEVIGFMAPFTLVKRKSDGAKGVLMFQHSPRFYFDFKTA